MSPLTTKETNMKITVGKVEAKRMNVKALVELLKESGPCDVLKVEYMSRPNKMESTMFYDGAVFVIVEHTDVENVFVVFDDNMDSPCTMNASEMLDSFKGCGKCFTVIPRETPLTVVL